MLGTVAEPGRIVIATAASLAGDVRAALASEDLSSVSVAPVSGSAHRVDCLEAALKYLRGAQFSTSHVLIHDISSPLASAALAGQVVEGMRGGGQVVMPALAVTDSVKAVDAHGSVTATLDRSVLRAVQYPRGFTVDALSGLLARDASEDFDEVAAAMDAAVPVLFIEGDPDAFRAELPMDAELVEAIIASRPSDA
jgi:2-C-methyl-D-erythritol 4-phosphate cytidylyltransferase